jgi:hypothetical protein
MGSPDNNNLMPVSETEVLEVIESVDTEVQDYLKIETEVWDNDDRTDGIRRVTITELGSDDERIIDIQEAYQHIIEQDYVEKREFDISNHLGGFEVRIYASQMSQDDLNKLPNILEEIWSEREQLDHGWIA